MADLLERLNEEVMAARFNKNTRLKSRLQESMREIEYLRWAINMLASINDADKAAAINEFAQITKEGIRIGPAHHIAQMGKSIKQP